MPRGRPSVVLAYVGVGALLANGVTFGLRLVRQIDDMMFAPHPRHRATIPSAFRRRS